MKKTALIPARYASTRLPGKMLKDIGGKPLVVRTYEAVVATGLFDEVVVVCDDSRIFDAVKSQGGEVVMSQKEHACGTDRIAEAVRFLPPTDIVLNVQGDEPFTEKESLAALLAVFEQDNAQEIKVASLMHLLTDEQDIADPNQVKVVVDKQQNALLFSRSPIPYRRDRSASVHYYKHIGIYAFRRDTLSWFAGLSQSPMEQVEQLENLRLLENGVPIKMVLTEHRPIGIDTENDLEKARLKFESKG